MTPPSDTLEQIWSDARGAPTPALDLDRLQNRSAAPLRTSLRAQLSTAAILSGTLAVLLVYFFGLVDLAMATSDWGTALMIGSLASRIAIEVFGAALAWRIDRTASTADFARATERLLAYRTGVHRGVVVVCLAGYTLGYYLLFPEFDASFGTITMWLLGLSYPLIMAVVWRWAILPGLREERVALAAMRAALRG